MGAPGFTSLETTMQARISACVSSKVITAVSLMMASLSSGFTVAKLITRQFIPSAASLSAAIPGLPSEKQAYDGHGIHYEYQND